jgi:tetratricopeptide (TPR) repeat protein
MGCSSSIRSRWFLKLLIAAAVSSFSSTAWAQSTAKADPVDPDRARAFDLYESGKMLEAMPLLEKVAADHPKDAVVFEHWAYSIVSYAATLTDREIRKKVRVRGRQIALKAKELGDNSPILQLLLQIPEDGTEPIFSKSKEVDEAMKAAEAAFVRDDLENARAGYLRALLLDPNNYEAALFIGDVYFRQHVFGSAGEWFSRAIEIDPNRETAYRYWADALAQSGKNDAARTKFIEAVVADPYNHLTWAGLQKWVGANKVEMNYVKLKDHSAVTIKDDKTINVTLDSSLGKDDPNAAVWMSYGLGRAAWHTENSQKEFPNVPRNRHTLQEEAYALNLMITVLKEEKDYQKKLSALDSSLQALVKIQEAGFLDAFVLLNRADAGIAQDYEAYRLSHRDKIRLYLDEFVVPKTPAPKN